LPDKHPLRTFILGTAIGGLLLGLFQWITGFISIVWHACKSAVIWSVHLLLLSIPVPLWLIIIILPIIISTLIKIYAAFMKKKVEFSTSRDYNQDDINGVRWRWRYTANGDIINLYCLCPYDSTQLVYSYDYRQLYFRCETCGEKFGPFEGDHDFVLGMIERQIHRKLRSGESKPIVEKLTSEGCHQ
jgi:hypothetical protein